MMVWKKTHTLHLWIMTKDSLSVYFVCRVYDCKVQVWSKWITKNSVDISDLQLLIQ